MTGEQAPRIGSTEWQAEQTAKALLKQDAALETLRKRATPHIEVIDTAAEERRQWALSQAIASTPAQRMGGNLGSEGMVLPNGALMAVRRKDGLISEMQPGAVIGRVIGPGEWDEHDAAWKAHIRRTENELLAREFGADECIEGGLFTREEAAMMDPERSRHIPLPRGAEAL